MKQETKDVINDCYVEFFDVKPNDKQIELIFNHLPNDVVHLANQWGWYDTEVRDKVWCWIRSNKDTI